MHPNASGQIHHRPRKHRANHRRLSAGISLICICGISVATERQSRASLNRHHALHLFVRGIQHCTSTSTDLLGHFADAVAVLQNPKHRAKQRGRDTKRDQRENIDNFLHGYKKAPGLHPGRVCVLTVLSLLRRVFDAKLTMLAKSSSAVVNHTRICAELFSHGHIYASFARQFGLAVAFLGQDKGGACLQVNAASSLRATSAPICGSRTLPPYSLPGSLNCSQC